MKNHPLIDSKANVTLFILRVSLGIILFAHGAQKMLGWFGGHGPSWTVEKWTVWFGFPPLVTWLVIIGEFVAPLLLLAGLFTRIASGIIAMIMLGAVYFVHFRWGFFMNWYGEQGRGEGFEYHILASAICAALMISGSGKWSVDRFMMKE